METELERLRTEALADLTAAADEAAVEAVRVKYLGRAGGITRASEGMRTVPKEDKARIGRLLNEVRAAVTAAIEQRQSALQTARDAAALGRLDITLPGTPFPQGAVHPLTLLHERAVRVLRRMGFALADGPDIETEWHCFDALNTPADHPARNEQDTFYLPDGRLLRTQTSTVQVRVMEKVAPPVRVAAPGACYRRDEVDATHLAQFNQIEGLYVNENVTVSDLKSTVEQFVRGLFGPETEVRLRPHFFPFTEPSFEVDVKSAALAGGGRWLELAGCGMVDPAVFEAINRARGDQAYDPERWSGFAFGFGLDRLAMIMGALPDIRLLIENDVRFLGQFAS
jgi:phenylalanyl-tRNA synthetase alpha chain